ncbi:MAG TPA: peptidoglycan DD-metalloendopeptidase family protein [Solirubrobacteraceae bacterium]|nr:peptidoglycan DD-metalloendopeptidase family protein [Solirubrobacteraceae bacterium]
MKAKPEGTARHHGRGRVAAALCTAGVAAIALSGNLLGASAQELAPVPGEAVAAPPTQIAAGDPSRQSSETETTPGEATTTATTPTDTTTTETSPAAPAESPAPAPAEQQPAAAPAPAPAPAAKEAAASLPFNGVAGPVTGEKTELVECVKAESKKTTQKDSKTTSTKGKAVLEGGNKGAAAGTTAPEECEVGEPAAKKSTTSPGRGERRDRAPDTALRNAQGVPTLSNPTMSLALPGAIPVGVPNFFIDKFRIPPFLLPIYQAAGIEYGIRWEVLAAINEIETDYGRNLNISSAGALGWMQFMPATWKSYGTDANRDGRKDPFNPVDAIFAAARYLRAAGADQDLRRAIFAYNHADWYVESVLMRARLIGGLPSDLVGSLNGLTQGHFPVFARSRYADDLNERAIVKRMHIGQNVANPVESEGTRRGIDIFAKAGSPAIAVQDGTIVAMGTSKRLGNFVRLRDVYGNTYTYAHLKKVAKHVPVPKHKSQSKASIAKELALPERDPKPTQPASAGRTTKKSAVSSAARKAVAELTKPADKLFKTVPDVPKERLFANPSRPHAYTSGGEQQILEAELNLAAGTSLKSYFTGLYGLGRNDVVLKPMLVGRKVIAGTILGRIGQTDEKISPRLHFEIRPAGRGAPRIDPKPILDGWKLLESTAIYRAQGRNALVGPDANRASIGQIMLMSKDALAQRVLDNPRIEMYSCGRRDIEAGIIDRRVLATLEFLAASGLKPTVTSLTCGHGYYTSSGNVSAHSSGNAIDIAKINGIPLVGHQGEGSITDITIRRLLTLQGTAKPNQIISLMTYDGTDNTLAMSDHADHIHVGFRPQYQAGTPGASQLEAVLKPSQWIKLIDRLGAIDNPTVSVKPSKYAIPVRAARASESHRGE